MGTLQDIFTLITTLKAVIPPELLENFYKVFNRLTGSAVDTATAYIEAPGERKRAGTEAQKKLILETGDFIASQLRTNPQVAEIAIKTFGRKIIRDQENLNAIARITADRMLEAPPLLITPKERPSIDDDWLNTFENEGSQKSTEYMQSIFGRILAGEINQPASFSIRTIKLVGQIDQQTAELFRRLCSICFFLKKGEDLVDGRAISLGQDAAENSLLAYGLGFRALTLLEEHGLIISTYNSYYTYEVHPIKERDLSLKYEGKDYHLSSHAQKSPDSIQLRGVALTLAGLELSSIVDIEPNKEYSLKLTEYLKTKQLELKPSIST